METVFCISINIRSGTGYELLGKFMLGCNRQFAIAVFKQLKGNVSIINDEPIQLDFIESRNGLPVHLEVMSCSLNQLAENTRLITKEKFMLLNMESR